LLALSNPVAGTESDVTFDIVSGPVLAGETVELYYTIPAGNDGLESVDDGTPLVGWAVAESVTNGSEVTGSTAEGFEGTGAPAGWSTVTGSPNYDDATAPAPATGAQSLSLLAGAAVRTPDTGDASTRYFAFSFINDSADNTSNADILALRNAATTIIGTIYRSATDIFYLNAGTKYSSATALPLTAGTKYFVWMEWVTDPGGSTGVFRVRVGTTGTYADSTVWKELTNSDAATNVRYVDFKQSGNGTGRHIFDDYQTSTSPIGDI